ncbi:unnamed protein product (macronuclear) [Paramecium tetraurelia]|uniref:Uncharacterized protein n=1 Tax=Paramecium tetraurelia TaxID=5888 RepID=A0C864_PARTE|nr:uncharacterized protein GSPATT00036112001 [Paramecium tetraurelia]CAK66981.1 unnamed protein product [Paramecium tetraurelia]|eukprot:XP_001434378.1 hypothetical protein (macronuclear) [Paramecium tetraurelia strain d4-2]
MDKQMIFSFQTQKPKIREQVKRLEYFQQELSQIQDLSRQNRSKSSTDMHSITTADSRQYQGYYEEVSAFALPKKDIFTQSLNKIQINQQNKEIQTETLPKPKLEILQENVMQLQLQKEEIFNQIKTIKKENGLLISQNKSYEIEINAQKNKINELMNEQNEKEQFYQQTMQQQNWQIKQLTSELQQLYNKQQQLNHYEINNAIQMLMAQFSQVEQDNIVQVLKEAIKINKNERLQVIQDWIHVQDIKEEIIQLKKHHNIKLKELMEQIKILQNDQIIEPELLSTQESLQLVSNILYRAIKSNEMLKLIKQNTRMYNLIEDLWNKLKFRLEHSNFSQQHIRTSSLNKVDLNSTNKKFSSRKL